MQKVQNHFHTAIFREINHLLTARARIRATQPGKKLKILSFGSSIGEEVVTLRYLFPEDEIYGCDINPALIVTSARSVGSLGTIFTSSEQEIAAHGPFDLILTSAVLCVFPLPDNMEDVFPVSRFDEMIELLDQNLELGGLLVITNAAYRFINAPVANGYTTVRSDIIDQAGYVDVFTRRGRPYLRRLGSAGGHVYQRLGKFQPRDNEDFADSIFEKKTAVDAPEIVTLRLAAPPSGLRPVRKHMRSNVDYFNKSPPERFVEVRTTFELCQRADLETYGYIQQTGWTSFLGEGMYWRKPIWRTVPSLDPLVVIR
jgi:hypothetical protein